MAIWKTRKNMGAKPASEDKVSKEVARINDLVAVENEEIDRNCLEIGKKYVQMHALDYEAEFAHFMKKIADSQENLHDYSFRMQVITGVIACTQCGHMAPRGSVFCNMCGSRLPDIDFDCYEICDHCSCIVEKDTAVCPECAHPLHPPKKDSVQCPQCGKTVEQDKRFCPHCATVLNIGEVYEKLDCKPGEKKCHHCGAVMSSSMRFCTECATELM